VNYGITRGFTSAARSAFGAGFADMTYAIVAFVAGDLLVARLEAHRALYEIGAACLLVIFGGCMLWSALRARAAIRAASPDASRNELVTTYALTIINPLTIVAFAGFADSCRSPDRSCAHCCLRWPCSSAASRCSWRSQQPVRSSATAARTESAQVAERRERSRRRRVRSGRLVALSRAPLIRDFAAR